MNGGGGAVGPVTVPVPVPLGATELPLPLVRVKLAQVRRVLLLVWMTMERFPKKLPGPAAVER